jgi:hypothetical protein
LRQAFNLMATKTRFVSVWSHGPLANVTMVYGLLISVRACV